MENAGQSITVTGVRQAYRGNFAVSEIPQSIGEIEAETLQDNAITRLTDALDLNASVSRQNTLGGLWDSFAVRGFAGDENLPTGYLVNGFNGGRGFGGQRDAAGIERVEVLKGPAAALLGRGEPGGTVNLVTRQAVLGETFGTAAIQASSFETGRVEADANIAVTGGITARLIGYFEDGGSFRDTIDHERWGLLPSFGMALGADTRLTYDFEWTRVTQPFDRGIVVLDGNLDTVPRDRFLGEPGDEDHVARATGHQLRLQHDFSDRWSLLVGASHRDTLLTGSSSDAETVASRQALYTDGRSLSRQRRSRVYDSEQSVVRAEIAGDFDTGPLRHRVLVGADHDKFINDQLFQRFRPPPLSTNPGELAGNVLDILNPVYGRFPLPTVGPDFDRVDKQSSTGIFIQDQISLTDALQIRLGGRYDSYTLSTDNQRTNVFSERQDSRFSPQAGIVYRVADPLTLYAAYGQGFRANIGTDVSGAIFDPEVSESIEAGVKIAMGRRLSGTLTLFQLNKENVLASDANNAGYSVAIGTARSRGVELDLQGELPGAIEFLLSYAHIDAEARSAVLDPAYSFQINPGDPLINIPDHTVNLQLARDFMLAGRDARIGGGVQYVGKRSGETGTDFMLPDHVLARLFGEVELADHLTLYGTVANLFDEEWYASSYHRMWVAPGTPRTFTVGLRAGF
nr:TonB-dependent siderophore receptor [Croceibacterium ferulae]